MYVSTFRVLFMVFAVSCLKAVSIVDNFVFPPLVTAPSDQLPFQILFGVNLELLSSRKFCGIIRKAHHLNPCENNWSLTLCLLLAGDVELNPGPRRPKFPCGICNRAVKQTDPSVLCDQCGYWVHNTCSGLSSNLYHILQQNSSFVWVRPKCGLPSFSSSFFTDSEVSLSNSFSPLIDHTASDQPPRQNSTPLKSPNSSCRRSMKLPTLKVISINLNGIRSKTRTFHEMLLSENPDIVLCQETRVDATVASPEIYPPGYTVYRRDRDMHGGGVSVLVRESFKSCQGVEFENDSELSWALLTLQDNSKLYIGSFYRPPDKKPNYIEFLRESLDRIYSKHPNKPPFVILCGDFNYPHIDWTDCFAASASEGKNLLDILNDYHLQQLVETPTYLCRGVRNILDLVLSSHPSQLSTVTVGREFSDHCIISFSINKSVKENLNNSRRIFLLDKGNYNDFRTDMKLFSTRFLSALPELKSINENWDKLKQTIKSLAEKHIPTKFVNASTRKPAWLNPAVRKIINKRNRLARSAIKSGSKIDLDRYRKTRNLASKLIDDSYSDHLNKILNSDGSSNREFYRFIKSRKTEKVGVPDLKSGPNTLDRDQDKAEWLNKYFCSVFTVRRCQRGVVT